MSQAPEKIHDPETGIYIGLAWSRGERWYAEDRSGDQAPFYFDERDEVVAWLCRQATMTREAA